MTFLFLFLCAKICTCFLNFGSDSILIHEIYFYFSYNPLKIYIRDMPFFDKNKKTYLIYLFVPFPLSLYHMANGGVI